MWLKFSVFSEDTHFLNYDSHISIPIIQMAKENRITLITCQSHITHKIQQLNQVAFDSFEWMIKPRNSKKVATTYDVIQLVGKNAFNAFKITGIIKLKYIPGSGSNQ